MCISSLPCLLIDRSQARCVTVRYHCERTNYVYQRFLGRGHCLKYFSFKLSISDRTVTKGKPRRPNCCCNNGWGPRTGYDAVLRQRPPPDNVARGSNPGLVLTLPFSTLYISKKSKTPVPLKYLTY